MRSATDPGPSLEASDKGAEVRRRLARESESNEPEESDAEDGESSDAIWTRLSALWTSDDMDVKENSERKDRCEVQNGTNDSDTSAVVSTAIDMLVTYKYVTWKVCGEGGVASSCTR